MRDASGQLWHDIDDNNLSEFLEQYPDAVVVSEENLDEEELITDETLQEEPIVEEQVQQDIEADNLNKEITSNNVEIQNPDLQEKEQVVETPIDPNAKYQERLRKNLLGYDAEQANIQDSYKFMGYDAKKALLSELSEADQTLIAQNEWNKVSEEAQDKIWLKAWKERATGTITKISPLALAGGQVSGYGGSPLRETVTLGSSEIFNPYRGKSLGTYEKDVESFITQQKEGEIPTGFLDSDLGTNLIGHEEEEVVSTLNGLYGEYDFKFTKAGWGDAVRVYAPNGKDMVVDLDNWTESGDKEEALRLKGFLDENKGEYKKRNFEQILALANTRQESDRDEEDIEWFKDDEGINEADQMEWDALYDEEILNEKKSELDNKIVDFQSKRNQIQLDSNKLTKEWNDFELEVKKGKVSSEEFEKKKAEFQERSNALKASNGELNKIGNEELIPLQNNLNIVSGYQTLIQSTKGTFLGSIQDNLVGIANNFDAYGRAIELEVTANKLRLDGVSEEEITKIIDKEKEDIKINWKDHLDSGNTNEYQNAFDNTVVGGTTKAISEMLPMMGIAAMTGPAFGVTFGALMGIHQAGGVIEEMDAPEFDDVPNYQKLLFATSIGVVNGALEGATVGVLTAAKGAYSGLVKPIGRGIAKGVIPKSITKWAARKVFSKAVTGKLTEEGIKRTTKKIVEEGIKKGTLQVTKKGLGWGVAAGLTEIGTELTQTGAEAGMKYLYNLWKEEEQFQGIAESISTKNLKKTAIIAGITGGMFGTVNGFRQAANANKGKSVVDKLSNNQFRQSKAIYLDRRLSKDYSTNLMNRVLDPNDPMTKEKAEKQIRDSKYLGGLFQTVDKMGLTIEGEKMAFSLLQRKQQLQKELDGLPDKAIGKRQREEITKINEALEDISLNENFETAYQRGLDEAQERQVAADKGFNIYKTDKEFAAKMKEFGEVDEDGFKFSSGYYRSPDGAIHINDAAARRLKDISVGQHELLHGITAKQLEGRGQAFKDQLILDFKKQLPKEQLKILDEEVTSAYGENATSEEYFNKFVDLVVSGEIKQDENIFTKIGDWITTNVLKPLGFKQASFKNGKEVYRFIKGYAKQSRAIAKGTQKGFTGDIGDIVSEGSGIGTEGQMSRQVPVVKGVDPKQVQTMIDKVANRAWTRFGKNIPKNIAEKAGLTRRSYIDSAKSELGLIAEKFDASKAEFDRYMANTGMQRLNSLATKLGVEDARKGVSTKSIDSEQARQIEAEEDTYVDKRSEKEIRQTERKGVKVRKRIPKVYDVDTVVESIRKKAKGKDFKGKNIKQLKGFALKEVVDMIARDDADLAESLMKKLDKNSDLNKGEMLAIQNFINADTDLAIGSLLEGYTSEFKATGVVNKLLEKFYNKRSVRAKTGPGLNVQIKKPNINPTEFKEAFGIIGKDKSKWNQKVPASKGGVSDILKGFVRNFDQVISSQEIREQKIIEGDLESAKKLSSGIPQGFFSKKSDPNQGKTLDEILFDIYGTEKIDEVKKFQLFGEALRTKLNERPEAAIGDLIRDVAEQLEIKEGFAYEQVIYDVIQDSINKYDIPGLTVGSGPTEVGGAADIEVNFFGQEVGFEAKKNNARFGSVTASYDVNGDLIIKKDYTFDKLLKQMLKSAKPEIDAYIKEGNKIGKRLFGNKYKTMKYITDAMPAEVYEELKNRGFQKKITQTMKVDTDFVSELYWGKNNGTAYIQIQGLGTYYLKDPSGKNIENPLELDVPPFDGNLDLVFSISSNTANNPTTYDNNDLEVRTKNAKGNPLKRGLPGSEGFRRISLRFQPSKLTGLAKSNLQLDNPSSIKKAFGQSSKQNQITKKQKGAFESNQELNESTNVLGKFSRRNQKQVIQEFLNIDKALNNANAMDQPVKKARVFDFDDTVARTKSNVIYTMPDGTTGKLTAEEFAKQGDSILEQGGEFDFSEFNKVMDGKKGPLFDLMKKMKEAAGDRDMFILTARAPEAAPAIQQFLKEMGVDIPLKNITGLGDSSGKAKAQWIVNKAAEGYNDFYFADDAAQNVKAVRDALEVLDVKSKVQQARLGKFSKQVNKEFNDIIQESTGEPADTTYSAMRAKMMGGKKGRFKFFIPYSAEDFMGLIYPLLGKGKAGDQHMKWFKEMLLDPFAKANAAISASRLQLMEDFKALKENLNIAKNLQEKGPLGFTNEQAVRVYIWAMQGMKIEGLSDKEVQTLINHVQGDSDLRLFSQELINITKGDGYAKPGKNWLAGTITTDLMETLNTVKRAKYLQQWQNNVDVIFSEENLNKLEALYGTKYREALENSLSRMKSGKNRLASGNRLSNKILDYINGSVGAIMFLNIRSAVLQTISSINFVNWTDNNPLKAGAAFANQSQYWEDFMTLVNSDFLKDRRQGLKLNINEAEIANAAKTSKNKAKAALNYILEKGYAPTKFADSFAIASGGATFYRNRINTYLKEGKSEREAKAQALQDFREIAEESQQSSRPDKISSQQASDLGRIILAFANTPMQYARLQKRAFQDLINGRGDAKSNVSKIVYYGFVQNLIFNALQQAVFALGFGDDDEEEKEEKIIDTANGMADSLLRGLGVGGVTASVIKNFLLDIYERSGRSRPEYSDSVFELIKFSPPISSKISKLRGAAWAFDSKKRRQEIIDKGFALDNPAYESFAKVITATTNAPLDRLYLKLNNIEAALSEEADLWQSVAMMAGWPEWIIMPKPKVKKKKKKKKKKGGYRKTNLRIGGKQGKRKTTLRL